MAGAIVCRCEVCGTGFAFNKHKANRVCSMPCYRALQRSGAYQRGHGPDFHRAPCAHCGATVERFPSVRRNGEQAENVFCDRSCYDNFRIAVANKRGKPCVGCGAMFSSPTPTRRFCGRACWSLTRKATPKQCLNCDCLFTPVKVQSLTGKVVSTNGGKTCSAQCLNEWIRRNPERKRKIGDAFRGANHPNWQGGKSLMNNVSARGPNWASQRKKALARDRDACVDCGMSGPQCREVYGRGLDVDHVEPFHNFGDFRKANALANLQSRCASCHKKAESQRSMVQMMLPMQETKNRQHRGWAVGERHPKAKLTAVDVVVMRNRMSAGEAPSAIAKEFSMSLSSICNIRNGLTWKRLR